MGLGFFGGHFTTTKVQRRQVLLSLPRGGRDGCTSPSWNAPLPSLSVSVSPIHAGLYPALLYVSSYAHAPVLSLSLWHVSLEQTEINFQVLLLKIFTESKTLERVKLMGTYCHDLCCFLQMKILF